VKQDSFEIFLYSGVKTRTIFQPQKQEHFFGFLQEYLNSLGFMRISALYCISRKKIFLFENRKVQPRLEGMEAHQGENGCVVCCVDLSILIPM
jgi:hypothetical protein